MFNGIIAKRAKIGGLQPIAIDAIVENLEDLCNVHLGRLSNEKVRRVRVTEAAYRSAKERRFVDL